MQKLCPKIAFAVLLASMLSGCQTVYDSVCDLVRGEQRVDTSVVATWWDGPKVRPGIALIISAGNAGMEMTTMDVLVDQNGEITLPLLLQKPVACNGMTLEELKQTLIKAYGEYFRQPQVTVTFAPGDGNGSVSPWGTITVMGQVGNPGPVNMPATRDMTVTRALQAAGGLKPYANRSRIRVTRCDREGRQTRTYVDFDEIGKDGRPDKDIVLRAGDVVWVPEVIF